MATSSSRQNSRFSSLKVFKFPTAVAAAASKPPPLPPKDTYYMPNPSLPSLRQTLSPDSSSSQPATPISPSYVGLVRSPSPSPSYAPSRVTMSPSSSSTLSPDSASSRKGLFKFASLVKRPKTPKSTESATSDPPPPDPDGDPSISMPWNFQHNLHVDEGYFGLPPTWSASLANLGYSPEEIATINTRRAAARSPYTQSIYSLNRSGGSDPASATYSSVHHLPRATSPPRSDASASQPSLVLHNTSRTHSRNASGASRQYSEASSSDVATPAVSPPDSILRGPPQASRRTLTLAQASPPPNTSSDVAPREFTQTKSSGARTPPRRAFHVANESLDIHSSPPPAYSSYKKGRLLDGAEENAPLASTSYPVEKRAASRERFDVNESLSHSASLSSKSAAPPRLSLDKDTLCDLSSWTESLFSSIPSTLSEPLAPTSQPIPIISISNSVKPTKSSAVRSLSPERTIPPQKPMLLHQLPNRTTTAPSATSTPPSSANTTNPLWHEVMDMVRPPTETASSASSASKSPRTASPAMPITPTTPSKFSLLPELSKENFHLDQITVPRQKDNRDSDLSTMTIGPATIVRGAVARPAKANMVASPVASPATDENQSQLVTAAAPVVSEDAEDVNVVRCPTPNSSESRSSSSSLSMTMSMLTTVSATESASSTSCPHVATPVEKGWARERLAKSDGATFVAGEISITAAEDEDGAFNDKASRRPSVAVAVLPSPAWTPTSASTASPATPAPRYPGWVSEVVAPLQDFIDEASDPRELYADFQEIGEGGSGSVYAARVIAPAKDEPAYVAIKNVPLLPSGVPKLEDLRRELTLMKGVRHPHLLNMHAAYVDVVEDSLWLRMDLMERSLADVVVLVTEGIVVQEKLIAQFASDVLSALSFLHSLGIAHRDLRSDNLLVGGDGVVKIADFSSAVQVSRDEPMRSDLAGVVYWQPPEMRRGSYNALKVDVWSLGATVWEMAQAEPPFFEVSDPRQLADRWPPLQRPEIYSRSFHDFLYQCSQPNSLRPDPDALFKTPFIRNASGRAAVIKLLSECRAVEERITRRQSTDSDGTVSLP